LSNRQSYAVVKRVGAERGILDTTCPYVSAPTIWWLIVPSQISYSVTFPV